MRFLAERDEFPGKFRACQREDRNREEGGIDRAGLVGDDGPTHHGVFDLSYLRLLPNMTVMAPADENELQHMLRTALSLDGPTVLRYPRGHGVGVPMDEEPQALPVGKGEVRRVALDAGHIRDELGWRPRVAIEQGIPKAVEFYRAKRGR